MKDFGHVLDVFDSEVLTHRLRGDMAIGHTRYSTSGSDVSPDNIQPFTTIYQGGNLALCHNGNITNFRKIKNRLMAKGTLFKTSSDTELVLHLIAQSEKTVIHERVFDACSQLEGAFSLIVLTESSMIAVRDPNGFRPLVLGRVGKHAPYAYCLASETCAFDIIEAEYLREIKCGELLVMNIDQCKVDPEFESHMLPNKHGVSRCVFEYIYFSRPDSILFGQMVNDVRKRTGMVLAHEAPVGELLPAGQEPDESTSVIVFAVPDSSNVAALGYATELKRLGRNVTFSFGLIRNHYVGRTFIAPTQDARALKVRCKFNPVSCNVKGREVAMVDDSIVRGTTSKQLVKLMRRAGATKVHFRVASPPVKNPCFYGMDFPSKEELLANLAENTDAIAEKIQADSVGYLSVDGMMKATTNHMKARDISECVGADTYCKACFTGKYPVPISMCDKMGSKAFDW